MTAFKAGDTVRPLTGSTYAYNTSTRTVLHVGETWILYDFNSAENCMLLSRFEKSFEKIEPFFEVGKTYTRPRGWSIMFQTQDALEEFEVVRTDTENREYAAVDRKVAYGKLTLVNTGEYQWVTLRGCYEFDQWAEKR